MFEELKEVQRGWSAVSNRSLIGAGVWELDVN